MRAACAAMLAAAMLATAAAPARAAAGIRYGPSHSPVAAQGQSRGKAALRFALAQLGKPYAYGGSGPRAYDCAGLTQQAWRAAGLRIPRTAQQQAHVGAPVPLDRIKVGDIVIFYSDASHVGIYAGHGTVVVARRPGTVIRLEPIRWMPVYGVRRP